MKELLIKAEHSILKFLQNKLNIRKEFLPTRKPTNSIVAAFQKYLGFFYYKYKYLEETIRIRAFKILETFSSTRITYEIIYHSRSLIFTLFLLIACCTFTFFLSGNVLDFKDTELIEDLLTVYVASTTGLLAIIFSLYAVGFQMTTEKFSSKVTDYLNRERVGQFFFKFMTFASVFSLVNLLFQNATSIAILPLFWISTALTIISIFGVLIFKDDYLTKLKPRQVFQRIYHQNMEVIRYVNIFDHPQIRSFRFTKNKNVKSFKIYLPIQASWSLCARLRKDVDDRIEIAQSFFKDLLREGRTEDASIGIIILAYFLADYVSVVHYIDKKRGWWFPQYQEVVSADDTSLFPIKANYEAKGIGRMPVNKSKYDWVETKILSFLLETHDLLNSPNLSELQKNQLANSLITAYEVILAGNFAKNSMRVEKNVWGIYESQYFDLFEKTLNNFVLLGKTTAKMGFVNINFLNSLGNVKTAIIDGFSIRRFPGTLEKWQDTVGSRLPLLLDSNYEITQEKLPLFFQLVITDYRERLNVELLVEGRIITPIEVLETEILSKFEEKENEILKKLSDLFFDELLKLSEAENGRFYKENVGAVILGAFNQLIYSKRWDVLEDIIKINNKRLLIIFFSTPEKSFEELELSEAIDHGIFMSVSEKKKKVFEFYLPIFIASQINSAFSMDKDNIEQVLKIARRPLLFGSFAYLVSEFEQDFDFVSKFTAMLEQSYPVINLAEYYKTAHKIKGSLDFTTSFNVGYAETNRYRGFFRYILNSLSELPEDYIVSGGGLGISSRRTVKHPSQFIRKLAMWELSDIDQCIDGYIEWLEKREQIKRMINILSSARGYE